MRIPKRFQLHLAAGQDGVLQVLDGRVCATDGVVVAALPFGSEVQLDPGEVVPEGSFLVLHAWAQAVKGSQGAGSLWLSETGNQIACAGEGKPTVHFAPDTRPGEAPPIALVLEEIEAQRGAASLLLDAEALYRLSRALGAGEGVRLEFRLNETGRCCSSMIRVTPVEGGNAVGGIMPIVKEGQ
jgi:hypothetical protein